MADVQPVSRMSAATKKFIIGSLEAVGKAVAKAVCLKYVT